MLHHMLSVLVLVVSGLVSGASIDTAHNLGNHVHGLIGRQPLLFGRDRNGGGKNGGTDKGSAANANSNSNSECLNPKAIQTASSLTGQEPGTKGIAAGQSPAKTDQDNFINFCAGQTLTNGQQNKKGSCNGIPMGQIPATTNMISAMIVNPQPGDKLPAMQTFNIQVQTQHLKAGVFVNPTTNYYTSPQALDANGDIIGHCHVTVQSIGNLKSTTPPDPTQFAFFKGIDDAGNGKGLLSATVQGGLPAGSYRVCTMIAAANHQPVNMPVAQRGAQDDCTKFEVGGTGSTGNTKGGSQDGKGKGNPAKSANISRRVSLHKA